ncbi:MAG: helix-turn-helix transcriptional regulator [Fibromonadales bacterium]|nr:helix-turn-helix transcriptional regulator [Fibromonadales bacterium]
MSTLGDRIRELRGAHSQKWLAKQLGIPPTTLSNYENNRCELNSATILSLKTVFKVDTDWLLFGDASAKSIPSNAQEVAIAESNSGCNQCRELLRQLGIANERIYQIHDREMALLKEKNKLESNPHELEEK